MNIDEYCLHYDNFHAEFFPRAGTLEKRRKLYEESVELQYAIINHEHRPGNKASVIDETIDVMNTAIAYLRSEGILDPLWHGVMKLEKTAAKYKSQRVDAEVRGNI